MFGGSSPCWNRADIREQLEEREVAISDPTNDSLPYMGDIHWSEFGTWATERSIPRWIVVFENRYDNRWLCRNLLRNPEAHGSGIYLPGNGEVVDYCTRPQP